MQPFVALAAVGVIPLGSAVLTGAGSLPFKGIIHVAGINMFWRPTRASVQDSVRSAMRIVNAHDFASVAFPLIGSGSGGFWGFHASQALDLMGEAFADVQSAAHVVVVRYKKGV